MTNRRDPYERDSDKEYSALEADRIKEPPDRRPAPDRVDDSVDATLLTSDNMDEPEQAYESLEETRRKSEELREALRESSNRDPEVLAAAQSRRSDAAAPADLPPKAREFFDNVPEMPEDAFDTEEVLDDLEDGGPPSG